MPPGGSPWRRRTSVGSAARSWSATSVTARSTRSAPASNGSYQAAGVLRNRHGRVLAIDGLWAIAFGNDDAAGAFERALLHGGAG